MGLSRDEVIVKLCALMGKAWNALDPDAHNPCDCVCRNKGMWNYQNSGEVFDFMSKAIDDAIARMGSDSVSVPPLEVVDVERGASGGTVLRVEPKPVACSSDAESLCTNCGETEADASKGSCPGVGPYNGHNFVSYPRTKEASPECAVLDCEERAIDGHRYCLRHRPNEPVRPDQTKYVITCDGEPRTDSPKVWPDGMPLGVWLLVSEQTIRAFHAQGQADDARNSLPTKARESWRIMGPYDPRGYEWSRTEPPVVPDDACKPEALCWRAEELIAEVFGVEEGVVPDKTTAEAFVEIRRLRLCAETPVAEQMAKLVEQLRAHADAADREVGYAMADRCGRDAIDERRFKADGARDALRVAERFVATQTGSGGAT